LAIVTMAPEGTSKSYTNAMRIFEQLHAQVTVEDEVPSWAPREAARIAALSR